METKVTGFTGYLGRYHEYIYAKEVNNDDVNEPEFSRYESPMVQVSFVGSRNLYQLNEESKTVKIINKFNPDQSVTKI